MKMLTLTLAVLMLAVPVSSEADMERTFKVESGKTLSVDLETGGNLSISGWDKQEVLVVVDFDGGDEYYDVEIEKTGHGIDISSDMVNGRGHRHAPDFEIKVPRRFNLDLQTMGGSIEIDNVEGEIEGLTMGGELELTNLRGEIALKTMGGDITCRDSDLDGYVTTMGGEVLMENLVGSVKGSSMGGAVIYKNVTSRDGKSTGGVVDISTMGGSISVSVAPEGAKVHTMGGDIRIKSAKKFVRAKTMGGDVEIDQIDGWVKATTMGGDIEVTMVGDPDKGERHVTLTSMAGDIDLTVPDGLSMEFDIELAYTKGHEGDYDIHSDFDIEKEKTGTWDRDNGSPRKYIYGKGSVKGGKHRIRIKTINGHIYLNKGK
jgi:DUF4097 and DUF4098 domain-containing protein YvlB